MIPIRRSKGARAPILLRSPEPSGSRLDVVILGYNDVDIKQVERDHEAVQKFSGGYSNFKTNTINVQGERIPFMTLLNRSLATGRSDDPRFHLCELPSLGASYLKSFLVQRGFTAEVVNFFNHDRDRFAALLAESPAAVAITTTFYVDERPIVELIEFIRRHSSTTKVVVGGPHIYNLCSHNDDITQDHLFRRMGADVYVFDSQGELTLSRVLHALRTSDRPDWQAIPNLIYTDDNKSFQRTGREIENNDMDANIIDWGLFEPGFYTPTVQMRTARSCAFKCAFCRYPVVAGELTLTSIERVEEELSALHDAGVTTVIFIDDTFNVPLPRFKNICRMMIKNQFNFSWFSYFRCSNSDDEAFDLMQRSGCKGVFLGIESGDQTLLTNMNKSAKIERYKHGIARLKERDIMVFASMIIGYPGETADTVKRTMDFIEETAPQFYRAELYYHDTNAPVAERTAEFGIRRAGYSWAHATMDWREAAQWVETMYRTVKSSTILPLYMYDFWAMPYLLGKGIGLDTFSRFTRVAHEMLVSSLGAERPDHSAQQAKLRTLFAAPGVHRAEPHVLHG